MFNRQMRGKRVNLTLRSVAWLKGFPIHGPDLFWIRWYSPRFTDTRQIRLIITDNLLGKESPQFFL